ncbi:hypothetical protein [Brevibacterium sp. HMSC07C04]|uniref:hypothetical protein n=1 Tax=Brevibacterium sp. HMSC07C04 TaxID=1581130 RepID=UPI0008A5B07D|nr:hypothetical protein [Brevibacterium sp. HMSC07C04]OFS26847.1 hypothetical protein HMPREF3162_04035 [Brevibacterium sp. HMSC07C04]
MISASITHWEDGTDLVLSTTISADIHTVWKRVTSPMECALWFAPFRPVQGEDADQGEGTSAVSEASDVTEIEFDFEGSPLNAHVLSCVEDEHVLVELGGLGRISLRLTQALAGQPGVTVTAAHTYASDAEAAQLIPQVGPVWDTHLRLLAGTFGDADLTASESEAALYARYTELAVAEFGADSVKSGSAQVPEGDDSSDD